MHAHGACEAREQGGRRLLLALIVVIVMTGVEIVGGIMSGSLALLSDAFHMVVDACALGIGYAAIHIGRRPANFRRTYGYRRAEILAALANGVLLAVVVVMVISRAIERLRHPQAVEHGLMIGVAVIGLAANFVSLLLLTKHRHDTHNLRATFLHVLSDTLSSVAVIICGVVMRITDWHILDPIASLMIAAFILWQVRRVIIDSINVLLDSAPAHMDVAEARHAILACDGVAGIHDFHATTLTTGEHVATMHVEIRPSHQGFAETLGVIAIIKTLLQQRYGIRHVTVEPDLPHPVCSSSSVCELHVPERSP